MELKTLLDVLRESDIELTESSGDRWVARCPFHKGDRDPSFTVYPNDTYFCFGCEVWGDAVKFLVEYKGWSNSKALEYVGEGYKVKAEKKVIKVKNTIDTWKFLYEVNRDYHRFLLETRGALSYLMKRGLSEETILDYKLGYTDGRVLKMQYAWEYEMATEIGLITKDGQEMLSHRITIPNILEDGEADFLIGRTVTNDRIKYLGTRMPKPIFGFHQVRKSPIIFLAEGQFDWLILRQWGYPAAILGGSHLTRANQILLQEKHVVLVPDNDDAGESVVRSLSSRLDNVSVVDYSKFGVKDVAQLAQDVPNAKEEFDKIVKESLPWIITMSSRILARWFPSLPIRVFSP
jgi:DNA primase